MHVVVEEGRPPAQSGWPGMGDAPAGGHIFQTSDYLEAWASTIGAARGARLFFAAAHDDRGALFYLPLAIERRRGARILTFPDGGVADYCAPIVTEAGAALEREAVQRLWRQLLTRLPPVDLLSLIKMPDTVADLANPLRFVAQTPDDTAGHAIRLEADWATFAATRLHRAKDSRRKRRRLAEIGPVRFVTATDACEAAPLLDAMIAQKTERYVARRGADGFDRPGYRRYFAGMTQRFLSGGHVHLCALKVAETIVAAHWGLIMGNRFYCLMLSFDEHGPWAKYSPGRLLVEDMIAWCHQQGLAWFDLGFGEAAWKDQLCDRIIPMRRLIEPRTMAGAAYLSAAALARTWKQSALRMPRGLGTRPRPSAQ